MTNDFTVERLLAIGKDAPDAITDAKRVELAAISLLLQDKWLAGEIKTRKELETLYARAWASEHGLSPVGAMYFAHCIEIGAAIDRGEITIEHGSRRAFAKMQELALRCFAGQPGAGHDIPSATGRDTGRAGHATH